MLSNQTEFIKLNTIKSTEYDSLNAQAVNDHISVIPTMRTQLCCVLGLVEEVARMHARGTLVTDCSWWIMVTGKGSLYFLV